jgi:peflin
MDSSNISALRDYFDAVDLDNSNSISSTELVQVLAKSGLNFSLATCSQMIRVHDTTNSNNISFEEFQGLHSFLMSVHDAFSSISGGQGPKQTEHIPFASVIAALATVPMPRPLDEPALKAALKAFDPTCSGSLGLTEFIALCLFIKGASAVFKAFEVQSGRGDGVVVFNWHQFVYAAAHTR